jgi:hypothetical protein
MADESARTGDVMPRGCAIIELRLRDPDQVFHPIDASPSRDRELDPGVEDLVVHRAGDVPGGVPIGLMVYIERPPGTGEAAQLKRGGPSWPRHGVDLSDPRLQEKRGPAEPRRDGRPWS